jgi:SAM-dependent methyltransferase
MNEAELQQMERLEEDHWWFIGKRLLLHALLFEWHPAGRILDLGCGMGAILREFQASAACFGTDISPYALRVCRSKGVAAVVQADLLAPPFCAGSFDLVVAIDVIEHLDDDVAFLRAAHELLAPGGRLVIVAPAFQLLWSQHDVAFQHRRRYTARSLRAAMERAELDVERVSYLHTLVFPVALVWRLASYRLGIGRFAPKTDFWPVPAWLNRLLAGAYRIEAWLLERFDLPVGVSVACIARSHSRVTSR